jgi:hypothetical protein
MECPAGTSQMDCPQKHHYTESDWLAMTGKDPDNWDFTGVDPDPWLVLRGGSIRPPLLAGNPLFLRRASNRFHRDPGVLQLATNAYAPCRNPSGSSGAGGRSIRRSSEP